MANTSQRPITGYQVLRKASRNSLPPVVRPAVPGLPSSYNLPSGLFLPSAFPRLLEELLGKSPLRLVLQRIQTEKNLWHEILECGHEIDSYVEFLWDEGGHMVTWVPNSKHRRCRKCNLALALSPGSSPKKPVQSVRLKKERAA
jgi:hypothetical protein